LLTAFRTKFITASRLQDRAAALENAADIAHTQGFEATMNQALKSIFNPKTRKLWATAVRTTARMHGFIPGASPPDVITPMVDIFFGLIAALPVLCRVY
jgi:hypothetical protein